MPNRRYHIHVICAANDQVAVLDRLAIFFEQKAFLTKEINSHDLDAVNYSRRCIESCDFVLVLVGDSYGDTNTTGVSQLHLSYLNARTKNKPMLTLLKSHLEDSGITRQLRDFIRLIEQQQVTEIYYYDAQTDMPQLLDYAYTEMLQRHRQAGIGWVRANQSIETALQQTVSQPYHDTASIPATIQNTLVEGSEAEKNSNGAATLGVNIDPRANPDMTFLVNYTAHAFEGGNLTEVSLKAPLSWRDIITMLAQTATIFSAHGLQRSMNDLVSAHAKDSIKKSMPKAHAVSRCQVMPADLQWIQSQLSQAGWVEPVASSARLSRELWQLTSDAKLLVSDDAKT